MDQRIESFLTDVLALAGEDSDAVREGVRVALAAIRGLIDRAEAWGEPPEDPLLLFSFLYGLWAASHVSFNGDVMHELATQFLARAEGSGTTASLPLAHRIMGTTLLFTGDIAQARAQQRRGFLFPKLAPRGGGKAASLSKSTVGIGTDASLKIEEPRAGSAEALWDEPEEMRGWGRRPVPKVRTPRWGNGSERGSKHHRVSTDLCRKKAHGPREAITGAR